MLQIFQVLLGVIFLVCFIICLVCGVIRFLDDGIPDAEEAGLALRQFLSAPKRFWKGFTYREPTPKPKPRSAVE